MGGIAALPSKGRPVINIQAKFALFLWQGQSKALSGLVLDECPWTGQPLKGA